MYKFIFNPITALLDRVLDIVFAQEKIVGSILIEADYTNSDILPETSVITSEENVLYKEIE
jgi:hypothetical protein